MKINQFSSDDGGLVLCVRLSCSSTAEAVEALGLIQALCGGGQVRVSKAEPEKAPASEPEAAAEKPADPAPKPAAAPAKPAKAKPAPAAEKPAENRAAAAGAAIKQDIEARAEAPAPEPEKAPEKPANGAAKKPGWDLSGKGIEKDDKPADGSADDEALHLDLAGELPAELTGAKRIREVVVYLQDHGAQTEELLINACQQICDRVGVLKAIGADMIPERVRTVLSVLG